MVTTNKEILDGLEIISIGSLYNGLWDKKYWSSSRGKDRYPYPVGYQAVRTHNDITYKMEILEGVKGPLFKVTSTDGLSCSGQTPEIVWDSFQRKGCTRLKLWHGKRFACKIDGVEFFGFKNSFVQRLLRELVANGSGTSEKLMLSSNNEETSGTSHPSPCKESCPFADQQPYLAKPKVTRKRNRKPSSSSKKLVGEINFKKLRDIHNDHVSRLGKRSQENQNDEHFSASCKLEIDHGSSHNRIMLPIVDQENMKEQIVPFSTKGSGQLNLLEFSNHLEVEVCLSNKESEYIGSKNNIATEEGDNLPKEPLQLQTTSESVEEEISEASIPDDSQTIDNSIVASDALELDPVLGLNNPNQRPCSANEKINAEEMVVLEALGTNSNPEEDMGTFSSNANSEKSDFDSVGQHIAKSMMTVLLPRALPLLKTFSRKKKTARKASDISLHMITQEKEISTNVCLNIAPPEVAASMCSAKCNEETVIKKDFLDFPDSECATSLASDSFESDQCEHPTNDLIPVFAETTGANCSPFGQGRCAIETEQRCGSVQAKEESLTCQLEICDSKLNDGSEEYMTSNEGHQKSVSFTSNVAPGCTYTNKQQYSINSDENSVNLLLFKPKNIKVAPGCTQVTTVISDTDLVGTKSSLQLSLKEISVEANGASRSDASASTQGPNTILKRKSAGVQECMTCQTFGDDFVEERCTTTEVLLASGICPTLSSGHRETRNFSGTNEVIPDQQLHNLHQKKSSFYPESDMLTSIHSTSNFLNPEIPEANFDKVLLSQQNLVDFDSSMELLQNQRTGFCDQIAKTKKVEDHSKNDDATTKCRSKLDGITELVGCYVHPMPILLVLLNTKGDEIHIGVLCGLLVDKKQTLFIYKVPSKGNRKGCPSFIGHTSIILPISRDGFGREVTQDNYGVQFTPDGLSLALLNNIKVPCCREMKIDCPCAACSSNCLEKNAVKIVQVKLGHVSTVSKLQTAKNICCILVCESSHLVVAEESGKLLLWVMNSTWSGYMKEFYLPSDSVLPYIVELKRIPKFATFIVGHNGFGEFGIWDISKRILISRFSAPSVSVLQFLPISLFRWERKGRLLTCTNTKNYVKDIIDATKIWLLEGGENNAFPLVEGDNLAVWFLISTVSDSDVQNGSQSTSCKINRNGCWRLALLMNNILMLGSTLDQRAAAVGVFAGQGIIGTCDGLVYEWELSAGSKLGSLHDFKGAGVSCITNDDSGSGALAVASEGGQLMVYAQSCIGFTNGVSKQCA